MTVYLDASNSSKNCRFDTWIVSHSSTEILTQLWLKFLFLRSRRSFGGFLKPQKSCLRLTWGADHLTFEGKNILYWKNTGICWGKRFRGLGKKKSCPNQITHSPSKVNGRLLMRFPQECWCSSNFLDCGHRDSRNTFPLTDFVLQFKFFFLWPNPGAHPSVLNQQKKTRILNAGNGARK